MMMRGWSTLLTRRLGLAHPIIQAPMAGGATTPVLVAAASEAGALGFIAAAYLQPEEIIEMGREVHARTSRPFGVNLFAPLPAPDRPDDADRALAIVAEAHAELGLPAPTVPSSSGFDFDAQLRAALEIRASAFSFTFGMLPAHAADAVHARDMFVIGTATTVEEAILLEASGADAVVAQGSEAGAHRGTFAADFAAAMVGTIALVPQMVDAVRIPVIASGGIMDGRGVAAALALGASAVQLGTAFLTCEESGAPEVYKAAILEAREDETRITRAFSGRPARGIGNRFMADVERGGESDSILPYPLQNSLTRPMRSAAAKQGRAEFLSLWAGQGVRLARRESARAMVERLAEEANSVVHRLGGG
jgi:nitronate monooxygenase